ncbi:hypothetical protein GLO24_14935 [Carnobacterium maltaromaticum]|nr:UPF0758 domain-containing protein [Carnobacterium maltaromaticum]MBC9810462.1 hypothetical protein [Carnobacterium maltaromaticum]
MQERSLVLEVPKYSRPRERLEEYGEKALGTHELLAILLVVCQMLWMND